MLLYHDGGSVELIWRPSIPLSHNLWTRGCSDFWSPLWWRIVTADEGKQESKLLPRGNMNKREIKIELKKSKIYRGLNTV
mgnify:CR=1 FL=1